MTLPVQVLAQTTVFTDVRVFDGEQVLPNRWKYRVAPSLWQAPAKRCCRD
jgi:hypothetical protein